MIKFNRKLSKEGNKYIKEIYSFLKEKLTDVNISYIEDLCAYVFCNNLNNITLVLTELSDDDNILLQRVNKYKIYNNKGLIIIDSKDYTKFGNMGEYLLDYFSTLNKCIDNTTNVLHDDKNSTTDYN